MSTEFLERLKANRPDVDWDAEIAAARERRELANPDLAAFVRSVNEFGAAVYRALKPVFEYVARMFHNVHRALFPKQHRRCITCHPQRKPKPLAVDGYAYQRRIRARRKRKRR